MSLVAIANVMLRQRYLIVGLPVLFFVLAIGLKVWRGPSYSAEARFLPHLQQGSVATLAGLAAQFGINVAGAPAGESMEFYAQLLESRQVLRDAVLTEYRFVRSRSTADTIAGTLVTLLRVRGRTSDQQVQSAIRKLDRLVSVDLHRGAGIVTLKTTAPWPELAVQVNRRLLELVGDFNLRKRQSRAGQERAFVQARMREAQGELETAEGALTRFLTQNRSYAESPQLRFEANRLQRRVDFLQQVHTTLAQAYEQARIEEVRNTPVITILDEPIGSVSTFGGLALSGLLAIVLGGFLAVAIALVREYAARGRLDDPAAYAEFSRLRRTAAAEITPRHLLSQIRRRYAKRIDGD